MTPKKSVLLREIASVLRVDVAEVQCMDGLPIATLKHLVEVFRRAMNGTMREDRIGARRGAKR